MSRATGIVLFLSGLAIAVYGIVQPAELGQQADLARPPMREEPASGSALEPDAPRPVFRRPRERAEPVSNLSPPVVVTVPPRTNDLPGSLRRLAIPKDRDVLARELQKELRRVGCYEGELTGTWSPSTRRAMKAFLDRINARLPVEEPDVVLYTVVQDQRDHVCGQTCPVGEGMSADGRCVPAAILANANRKEAPAATAVASRGYLPAEEKKPTVITGWSSTTTLAAAAPTITGTPSRSLSPAIEGRMALAGPTAESPPAIQAQASRSHPSRSAARTAPPTFTGGGQRWSRAIFSHRNSNN
jgi:peptidoglycan hydrolase-like protein with peptidoglycan-binding domain